MPSFIIFTYRAYLRASTIHFGRCGNQPQKHLQDIRTKNDQSPDPELAHGYSIGQWRLIILGFAPGVMFRDSELLQGCKSVSWALWSTMGLLVPIDWIRLWTNKIFANSVQVMISQGLIAELPKLLSFGPPRDWAIARPRRRLLGIWLVGIGLWVSGSMPFWSSFFLTRVFQKFLISLSVLPGRWAAICDHLQSLRYDDKIISKLEGRNIRKGMTGLAFGQG